MQSVTLPRSVSDRHPGARARIDQLIAEARTEIHFQPIIDIVGYRIHGYEALARPQPESGFHSIAELLEIALACDCLLSLELHLRQLSIRRFAELGLPGRLFLNHAPQTLGARNYPEQDLFQQLAAAGIEPDRVVLELTEQNAVSNPAELRRVIALHRRQGMHLAHDDFASGYNGLLHWMDCQPDLIKIDRAMVVDIDRTPNKYRFVRTVVHLAKETGTRVVAEGVERESEMQVLAELGVDYLQGYLFGRPSAEPPLSLEGLAFGTLTGEQRALGRQGHIRHLVQPSQSVQHTEKIDRVIQRFLDHPQLRALPVLDGEAPVGIAWRHDLMNLYASPYGRPLNERRSISRLMDKNPIIVEESESLALLSRRITDQEHRNFHDVFIITRGRSFIGIGYLIDLLRAFTDMQLRQARYLNPLSQLPGNVPIDETLDALIDLGKPFVLVYVDLDYFKTINDHYGFKRGDNVLLMLTEVLKRHVHPGVNFLGHVGGDDFVLMFRSEDWRTVCERIIADFDSRIADFYDPDDRAVGYIDIEDRDGQLRRRPFCSVTLAALNVTGQWVTGSGVDSGSLVERISAIKTEAKKHDGSNLLVADLDLSIGRHTEAATGVD